MSVATPSVACMSAIRDLPPPGEVVAASCLGEIHRVVDVLDEATGRVGDRYAELVAEVERTITRLSSVKLKLVAAADRAAVAANSGMADTGSWLASQTRTGGAEAARQAQLAGDLERLPVTRETLAEGAVSTEHAAVIAHARRKLPAGLSDEQVAAVEDRLVEQAKRVDPPTLRKRARRALQDVASQLEADQHHDERVRDEEAEARAKTRLSLHDNKDGTVSGHFTVPGLHGQILRKILQQLASPRRGRVGASRDQVGSIVDDMDWSQRYGQAFCELIEHLPTDRLHGKVAATVVVNLDAEQLLLDLRAAGLDTGDEISASEARRLMCGAGILPLVLGGASQPLDLGRTQRFFTEAQHVALSKVFQRCIAQGCDRPFAWCELHHRDPWSQGGRTDLELADPLCGWHHQRIHDPAYDHRRHPDGSITFHRRT